MSEFTGVTSEADLEAKLSCCRQSLEQLGGVVVAFSGGVDSSLLLGLAVETLGADKVVAATAVSTIFPQHERKTARRVARQLGVELVEIETPQLADATFTSNPTDRCYYCKAQLLSRLKKFAAERELAHVITGSHIEDEGDYRPGARAEKQMGIRQPLKEAGFTKAEIRLISRRMKLPTWDSPSAACLASRIPYGQEITLEKLSRIERAEEILRDLGFVQLRVRDHDTLARIEVPADQVSTAAQMREQIVEEFKKLGYTYVTVDLQGFRSGSMNETLGNSESE